MGYEFDINEFKTPGKVSDQYQKQLKRLTDQGKSVEQIEAAVQGALKNLAAGKKRFVIYGEPQSGKTEMMICLTAKRLPPWQFTFHDDHIDEIKNLEKHSEGVWIALVCGEDGVVLITSDELREMNECDDETTWFVRVTRDRHTMYHLNGSADDLLRAKPRGVGPLVSHPT